MKIYLPCLLCVLPLLIHAQTSDVLTYDCMVDGTCLNTGSCDKTTGACDCTPTTFSGLDCTADTTAAACTTVTCMNGGTCFADTCFCAEGYTGTDCSIKRVSATCTATEMTISVYPYGAAGSFTGSIHIVDDTSALCTLVSAGGTPEEWKHTIAITDCGGTVQSPWNNPLTGNDEGLQETFQLLIQHSPDFITNRDTVVAISCITPNDGTVVTLDAQIATVDSSSGYKTSAVDTSITGITLSLNDASNDLLNSAQTLGSPVNLKAELDPLQGFADIQLDSLVAYPTNALDNAGPNLVMVTGGCAQTTAQSVLTGLTQDAASKAVTTAFNAFGFNTYAEVHFSASFKLCQTDPCAPVTCGGANDINDAAFELVGKRRRRRQADNGDVFEDSMHVAFRVISASDVKDSLAEPRVNSGSCLQNIVFLLPLVVLTVVCLFSMGIAVFFCLKVNKSKNATGDIYKN